MAPPTRAAVLLLACLGTISAQSVSLLTQAPAAGVIGVPALAPGIIPIPQPAAAPAPTAAATGVPGVAVVPAAVPAALPAALPTTALPLATGGVALPAMPGLAMPGLALPGVPAALPGVPAALPGLPALPAAAGAVPALPALPPGLLPANINTMLLPPLPPARPRMAPAPPIPRGFDFKPMWPTTTSFSPSETVISIGLENTPDDVYWRSKSLVKAVAKQAGVAEKDLYYYAVSPDTSATGVPMTRVRFVARSEPLAAGEMQTQLATDEAETYIKNAVEDAGLYVVGDTLKAQGGPDFTATSGGAVLAPAAAMMEGGVGTAGGFGSMGGLGSGPAIGSMTTDPMGGGLGGMGSSMGGLGAAGMGSAGMGGLGGGLGGGMAPMGGAGLTGLGSAPPAGSAMMPLNLDSAAGSVQQCALGTALAAAVAAALLL